MDASPGPDPSAPLDPAALPRVATTVTAQGGTRHYRVWAHRPLSYAEVTAAAGLALELGWVVEPEAGGRVEVFTSIGAAMGAAVDAATGASEASCADGALPAAAAGVEAPGERSAQRLPGTAASVVARGRLDASGGLERLFPGALRGEPGPGQHPGA